MPQRQWRHHCSRFGFETSSGFEVCDYCGTRGEYAGWGLSGIESLGTRKGSVHRARIMLALGVLELEDDTPLTLRSALESFKRARAHFENVIAEFPDSHEADDARKHLERIPPLAP
jgi:hypothetical protein